MKVLYGVNLYDADGDVNEECILIFIDETTILKFEDIDEYDSFVAQLKVSREEIFNELKYLKGVD